MPNSQNPVHKYWVRVILLVILALLFITQYIFNLAYWFKFNPIYFQSLDWLACSVPVFCTGTLHFPQNGLIALLAALLAAALFWGLFTWQKVPNFLSEPRFAPTQSPNFGRLHSLTDGALVIVFGLSQAYVIVQSTGEKPVLPAIWLAGWLTLLLLGWRLDQSRRAVSPWRVAARAVPVLAYGIGIVLLLFSSAAFYAQRWGWLLFFGLAALALWRYLKTWDLALPLLTLGSFLLLNANLTHWAWSFWGDEYSFYEMGNFFVQGTIGESFLSGNGVYGKHPVLSSVWQGVCMWLFGADGYGWRVSNSLLLAMSIPFFYYFLRPILGRAGALFAVTLYGSAHVLLSLNHYGANNVQAIFFMAVSLAAFTWAGRRGSWVGFLLTGVLLGMGFYTLAVARIYSLVIAVWLAVYYFPINLQTKRIHWQNVGVWVSVAGAALLTALPVLSTRSAWEQLVLQTVANSEVAFTRQDQIIQFLNNTGYGFTSFLFNDQNSHWIFGAHADPITSTLMTLGLAAMLVPHKQTWRVRASLLGSYILFVVIIAGTQQYGYPTLTRIFSFVPFYAIFAAIGLMAVLYSITASQKEKKTQPVLTTSALVLALVIVPLNFWQHSVLSQKNSEQKTPAFLLQAAQMSETKNEAAPQIYYVGMAGDEYWIYLVYSAQNISTDRLTVVSLEEAMQPDNAICRAADTPAIAIVTTEIPNSGYIASRLSRCWRGAELHLIKDMRNNSNQYRLINQSALPLIRPISGYWMDTPLPQTSLHPVEDSRADWTVYAPIGFSQNTKGQLAVVEGTVNNQVVFLNSEGKAQSQLSYVFTEASDVVFLPDDSFVVADAQQGLLWFDSNGQFRFISRGGDSTRGIFAAPDGTIYAASTGDQSIVQISNQGEVLRVITGDQFRQPTSIAVAEDGRIATADPDSGKVTINSNGGELLFEYPIGMSDTILNKAGLLWMPNGDLVYSDPPNNRVVRVDSNGKILAEWLEVQSPTDLILKNANTLLVLAVHENRIALITLK